MRQLNLVNSLVENASVKTDALVDNFFASIFGKETIEPINGVVHSVINDNFVVVENNDITMEVTVVEEDNSVSCIINGRQIADNGNINRIRTLFSAVKEGNNGLVFKLFRSLIEWKQGNIPVKIYRYKYIKGSNVGAKGPMAFAAIGSGMYDTLSYDKTIIVERRSSLADNLIADGKLLIVKIASEEEEVTEQTLAAILDKKDENTMSVKKTKGFMNSLRRMVGREFSGFCVLGGSPDRGLVVMIKKSLLPPKVTDAQKLAKLLLTGGNTLVGEYRFKLKEYKHRVTDGNIMLILPSSLRKMALQSDLPRFNVAQMRVWKMNECAMKGLATNSSVTMDTHKLVRGLGEGIDGVINLAEYRKIYGKGREGEVVTLSGSEILIHKTDNCRRTREVAISTQAILRAPLAIKNLLLHSTEEWLVAKEERLTVDPLHIFGWGYYKNMREIGIKPCLDKDGKIPDAVIKKMEQNLMEKRTINGASEYLIFDDRLDKHQISVPKNWKVIDNGEKRDVEIGDKIYVLAYPLLYGSETAFSMIVAGLHNGNYITINSATAKKALRDEDGDKPIFILPEQSRFIDVHQDTREFSCKTGAGETTYKDTVDAYCKLVSDVGSIDNLVTNTILWLGNNDNVETPTGEPVRLYLSKCIQAMIERKKHIVDERYAESFLREWVKTVLPDELFTSPEGAPDVKILKHHPILKAVKSPTFDIFKERVFDVPRSFIMHDVWQKIANVEFSKDGFVNAELYKEWAQEKLLIMMEKELASRDTIENIDRLFAELVSRIPEDAGFDDRISAFRAAVNQYKLACGGGLKHMTLLWVLIIAAYPQYVWMNVVDLSFLNNMGKEIFAHGADTIPEFNGRNKERKALDIAVPDVEFHATPNKKYVMVVNGMSRKLANGEVSRDQINTWLTQHVDQKVFFIREEYEGEEVVKVVDTNGSHIGYVSKDSMAILSDYESGIVATSKGYVLRVSPIVKKEVK